MLKNLLIFLALKVRWVNTVLSVLSGIVLLIMTIIVFYAVIMRYVFNMPPVWTTETSTFMLMFLSFIPLGLVFLQGKHITVDFFTSRMTTKTVRFVNVGNAVVAVFLFSILCWQSSVLVYRAFHGEWISMEMNIPLGYPYLILPLGCGLVVISGLCRVVEEIWPDEIKAREV